MRQHDYLCRDYLILKLEGVSSWNGPLQEILFT